MDAEETVLNKKTMCGIRIKLFTREFAEMSEQGFSSIPVSEKGMDYRGIIFV